MNLGFCPIASSSKGNSYIIKSDKTTLLLDMGVAGLRTEKVFRHLNLKLKAIDGILITHEHGDHIKGCNRILNIAEECKLYCSKGTLDGMKPKVKPIPEERIEIIGGGQTFMVGDIEVTAFDISHDANEPLAYSFKKNGKKISVVTDTGVVTEQIALAIEDSDLLVIESNHEVNILLYGRYPYKIKRRILSDYGHLSNEAAGKCILDFVKNLKEQKVPHVMLAHLSQENNTPQQAYLTIKNVLEEEEVYIEKDLKMEALSPEEDGDLFVI